MNKTKTKLLTAMLLAGIVLLAMMPAVEAKHWIIKYGHPVIVYDSSDIPSNLKPYIAGLEYDMAYSPGYGYGTRLYFTDKGRTTIASLTSPMSGLVLQSVTKFIMGNTEWYSDRGYLSVSTEIQYHAVWGRMQVDIEYFCSDLKWWEQPYKSYC